MNDYIKNLRLLDDILWQVKVLEHMLVYIKKQIERLEEDKENGQRKAHKETGNGS